MGIEKSREWTRAGCGSIFGHVWQHLTRDDPIKAQRPISDSHEHDSNTLGTLDEYEDEVYSDDSSDYVPSDEAAMDSNGPYDGISSNEHPTSAATQDDRLHGGNLSIYDGTDKVIQHAITSATLYHASMQEDLNAATLQQLEEKEMDPPTFFCDGRDESYVSLGHIDAAATTTIKVHTKVSGHWWTMWKKDRPKSLIIEEPVNNLQISKKEKEGKKEHPPLLAGAKSASSDFFRPLWRASTSDVIRPQSPQTKPDLLVTLPSPTRALTTDQTVANAPIWLLNGTHALDFLTSASEHPKVMSMISPIMITAGSLPAIPAVAAGAGGAYWLLELHRLLVLSLLDSEAG
ncbi:hypothetical protein F5146DRAFT_1189017 [Armillaria mellea]|nr:hypothetical protein F5146DRAFT_1189017 [Armillaria mellea]